MIEFEAKSPVDIVTHRTYMANARRIDADIVASRIKSSNPRLYTEMRLSFYQSKKLQLNPRTARMEYVSKMNMVQSWVTPDYYIVSVAGVTYYLKRNGL